MHTSWLLICYQTLKHTAIVRYSSKPSFEDLAKFLEDITEDPIQILGLLLGNTVKFGDTKYNLVEVLPKISSNTGFNG
jgi:hypothetical protein